MVRLVSVEDFLTDPEKFASVIVQNNADRNIIKQLFSGYAGKPFIQELITEHYQEAEVLLSKLKRRHLENIREVLGSKLLLSFVSKNRDPDILTSFLQTLHLDIHEKKHMIAGSDKSIIDMMHFCWNQDEILNCLG